MSANDPASSVAGAAQECFHCGLPVPAGSLFGHDAPGGWRRFCCPGCEIVSQSISGLGLDDYYRLRAQPAPRPSEEARAELAAFDDPLVQQRFVQPAEGGLLEAQLLLEGLRCSACAWLIEQVVAREPGVVEIALNYATRRARLRWDPAVTKLSRVLAAIRGIGYAAWPYEEGRVALVAARERRALLRRLWVAALGMMQVMMYAVPTYIAGDGDIAADAASLMRWAGLVLTLPVMAYSAAPFFAGAARDLRLKTLGMDVPIALGLAAAFVASVASTVAGQGEVYFDSITMFVFLLMGGRYLELMARQRAASALEHLARLVPQVAHRLGGAGDAIEETACARLAPGDRVLVRPGETVPADGELESAQAQVSEAWLSGESRPLARAAGDRIHGGSVNHGSAFVMRVTLVGADTALSSIQRLMERALGERPHWVEAAQRASASFVAVILLCALAAGITWMTLDPARALWIAVSVLVITCPCALALATPVAVTAATGALARGNLVTARAQAIERLAAATDVVFDKTGTLTHGEPRVLETMALGSRPAAEALALAASIARFSSHPLDRAFLQDCYTGDRPAFAQEMSNSGNRNRDGGAIAQNFSESGSVPGVTNPVLHAGQGIEAQVGGRRVRLGQARFVAELNGHPAPLTWIHSRDSIVYLGDEHEWIAGFRLGDALREDARECVERLRAMGLTVHLLSGDARGAVQHVAQQLGIEDFRARANPDDKRRAVRRLQLRGARVAMVGDGINDAPVLAQADVSIAMGAGADLAQTRADAVLLSNSLDDLARGIATARRARRVMRQNLAWALAYNLVAVPLAFAGMVTPLVAGIGMAASSLAVVANAARLRHPVAAARPRAR